MTTPPGHDRTGDRGALRFLAVLLVTGTVLLVGAGSDRLLVTSDRVAAAAGAAARAGAAAGSTGAARTAAVRAASGVLHDSGTPCEHLSVVVRTTDVPVTARVSCQVPLGLLLPDLPGHVTVSRQAKAPARGRRG